MSAEIDLSEYYEFIEAHEKEYKERLSEAVSISSVSAWPSHRDEIKKMLHWAKTWAEKLGAKETKLVENPKLSEDGSLPPLLLMTFDDDESIDDGKRCVLAYGHLDVQPAKAEDGWKTKDPFVVEEHSLENGGSALFGRGTSDDKGPALSWLWVIEAHRKLGLKLPVRLKLLFEGMEEYGSIGLVDFIFPEAALGPKGWLDDVDYVVVSDNTWIGRNTPCLTYGLRGMLYCELEVKGGNLDLHSGTHGGALASEPMVDLVHLLGTLLEPPSATTTAGNFQLMNGKNEAAQKPRHKALHERIRIPGILDKVKPLTENELIKYQDIDFNLSQYLAEGLGHASPALDADAVSILLSRWRFPTLSIHGIEGAFSEPGAKTVLPACVKGKFSLRLVPDMTPESTETCIRAYLHSEWEKLGSKNTMNLTALHGGPAWISETDHPNYEAAQSAIERVYGQRPNLTREGGSIPVANWLEEAIKVNVLLLPTGAADDQHHAQNEKYNVRNLISGIKVLGTYLHEISNLKGPRPSKCKCAPLPFDPNMLGAFARGFRCKCEW